MTQPDQQPQQPQVVVIGPDGRPIGTMPAPDADAQAAMLAAGAGPEGREAADVTAEVEQLGEMISEPAKVMRIGSMIKQLLDEVRAAPLDDASRNRLRQVHERSIHELEDGLSPELRDELHRLSLPFGDNTTPSDAELRIAQAQLVGWLEGLFHGLQTALFAQQMAARVQLEEMRRRALPGGPSTGMPGQLPGQPGMSSYPGSAEHAGGGQYL
ncbi:MAG: bacterial proteasome activator family protein [Actinomycetota bacterium]|nr:bacterial proteasome activator family protein [Actinomycetota bacterium]